MYKKHNNIWFPCAHLTRQLTSFTENESQTYLIIYIKTYTIHIRPNYRCHVRNWDSSPMLCVYKINVTPTNGGWTQNSVNVKKHFKIKTSATQYKTDCVCAHIYRRWSAYVFFHWEQEERICITGTYTLYTEL